MVAARHSSQLLQDFSHPLPHDHHHDLWLDGGRSDLGGWRSRGLSRHDSGSAD